MYVCAGRHAAACRAGARVVANGTVFVCMHAWPEMGYAALLHMSHVCAPAGLAGGGIMRAHARMGTE